MTWSAVDTNVLEVANGASPQADPACVLASVGALQALADTGGLLIDDGMRILGEYLRHANLKGQPGVGDYFLRWAWNNQATSSRCRRIPITPRPGDREDYVEFPDDSDLRTFDPSDRKFAAVVRACELEAQVVNAVDSDWAQHRAALERNGVRVKELCPQCLKPASPAPAQTLGPQATQR